MQQIALICIKLKNAQLSAGSKDDFFPQYAANLPFYPHESSTIPHAVDTHRNTHTHTHTDSPGPGECHSLSLSHTLRCLMFSLFSLSPAVCVCVCLCVCVCVCVWGVMS